MKRFRVLKHRIERRPFVWWVVMGRKMFDTSRSIALRRQMKVGDYLK